MIRTIARAVALAFVFTISSTPASATIGLIVGEPFGSFGTMMPAGHAGIYLDHLCAETPTHLRLCRPGEPGVILSRYHDLRATNTDWMAIPVIPFLYSVDDPANTPTFVTPSLESELREAYRQAHLRAIVPDRITPQGNPTAPPYGDWEEAIGAAFDRRLFLYTIDTTPEQDAAILTLLNTQPDRRRYTLRRANCADFAADLLNLVLPGVFHRSKLADFDLSSPKTLARQLETYGNTHPELHLHVYEIPQLPGTLRRSRPLRGAAETFVKTKRYLATLLVIQPEAILADWIIYEKKGKWTPGQNATTLTPSTLTTNVGAPGLAFENWAGDNVYSSASTSSNTASEPSGFFAK
jgi:hypothetical protein